MQLAFAFIVCVVCAFCYAFSAGRKIVQIGQTKPVGVCPEGVHRYAEWFSLFKTQGNKKEGILFFEFLP